MLQTAKGKVINKLALVLLSIVVLELVLIGNQVQPVKGIKKKIYLKKLKKLLPLLALVKPKKKIILLPIPIPMFKQQGHQQYRPSGQHQPGYMVSPMSVGTEGLMMLDAPPSPTMASNASELSPMLLMPSMSMTIQSDSAGSAIELSTNAVAPSTNRSAPLLQSKRPPPSQQTQQYDLSSFDEPAGALPGDGDQYYRSPWVNRSPLVSPAKLVDRFRPTSFARPEHRPQKVRQLQQRPPQQQQQPQKAQQVQLQMPAMVSIKNQWSPGPPRQQLELEEMVSMGPQQMMPVYQTPDGHLHLTPPTELSHAERQPDKVQQSHEPLEASNEAEPNSEVQTIQNGQQGWRPAQLTESQQQMQQQQQQQGTKSGRLVSPAVKAKQQQLATTKRKPSTGY